MRYLDRLLSRALAVPRPTPGALFDPFEQTAPWPLDEATRVAPRDPPAVTGPLQPTAIEPARVPPSAPAAAKVTPVPPPRETPDDKPARVAKAAIPRVPDIPGTTREPPDPGGRASPARRAAAEPLETADRFMRSLAPSSPDDRRQAPEVSPIPPDSPHRPEPAPARPQAGARKAARPNVAQPPPPRSPRPAAIPDRQRQPAQPPTESAPRAASGPAARPASEVAHPIARIARAEPRASARRDELAHGIGILRFGLSQS